MDKEDFKNKSFSPYRLPVSFFNGYPDDENPIKEIVFDKPEIPDGQKIKLDESLFATAQVSMVEKILFPDEGGILVWMKPFSPVPVKGLLIPEALEASDLVKKYLKSQLWVLGMNPVRYFIAPLFLLPSRLFKKIFDRWLEAFADFCNHTILYFGRKYPISLKPRYYSRAVREIFRVGHKLWGSNRSIGIVWTFFCIFMENDKPYRYRVQDFLSEVNMYLLLENPRKELLRVCKIIVGRDSERDWNFIYKIMEIALFIRSDIVKEIVLFFEELNQREIQFDTNDMFFVLQSDGYNYMGLTDEEKRGIIEMMRVDNTGTITIVNE
jgi:hypothetical protein